MNTSIYSVKPSGDLSFSHGARTLWGARLGYFSAAIIILATFGFSVLFCIKGEYPYLIKCATYLVIALIAAISNRNTVYKFDLTGERLSFQTAFGNSELRLSEIKDIYKIGDARGGFTWLIKTPDKNYKFQAKKVEALQAIKSLFERIASPPSVSWREYKSGAATERSVIFVWIFMVVATLFLVIGKSFVLASGAGLILLFLAFAMTRLVRSVSLTSEGIIVKNFLNQEKTVSWQSMKSIRRTKVGVLTLNTTAGKFTLNTVDGVNVVLDRILSNVAPNLYLDDLAPKKKLSQLKQR